MKDKMSLAAEQEIDDVVISQADDDAAWGKPVEVHESRMERLSLSLSLSSALAARVAFFARLHHEVSVEAWLERIIQERLDLEEAAFVDLKRELATRRHSSQHGL